MSNCCYTEIDIISEKHPDKLQSLDTRLSQWLMGDSDENWLGNLLIQTGLTSRNTIEEGKSPYRCRGSIIFSEMYSPDQLHVTTETAWVPHDVHVACCL